MIVTSNIGFNVKSINLTDKECLKMYISPSET